MTLCACRCVAYETQYKCAQNKINENTIVRNKIECQTKSIIWLSSTQKKSNNGILFITKCALCFFFILILYISQFDAAMQWRHICLCLFCINSNPYNDTLYYWLLCLWLKVAFLLLKILFNIKYLTFKRGQWKWNIFYYKLMRWSLRWFIYLCLTIPESKLYYVFMKLSKR